MARKFAAAADHGINAFIFDWSYYDPDGSGSVEPKPYGWDGSKYLHSALESGFPGAANNDRLKFTVMWCNHDVGPNGKGAVKPVTFETLTNYVIAKYFKHPSYWQLDGCPYFSIYQMNTFIETFGGDRAKTAAALARFREKVKAAGFPNLLLNAVLFGPGGKESSALAKELGLASVTSYVWIHHYLLPCFPTTDYAAAEGGYFHGVSHGGQRNGLEQPASALGVPYHLNVSMGWDSSPRCSAIADWTKEPGYPSGAVIVNNTPERFRGALLRAKEFTLQRPPKERVITINSWNEWGEGSYLEPDTVHGMKYLEAMREVFGTPAAK